MHRPSTKRKRRHSAPAPGDYKWRSVGLVKMERNQLKSDGFPTSTLPEDAKLESHVASKGYVGSLLSFDEVIN